MGSCTVVSVPLAPPPCSALGFTDGGRGQSVPRLGKPPEEAGRACSPVQEDGSWVPPLLLTQGLSTGLTFPLRDSAVGPFTTALSPGMASFLLPSCPRLSIVPLSPKSCVCLHSLEIIQKKKKKKAALLNCDSHTHRIIHPFKV